jgi:hypothetical protein
MGLKPDLDFLDGISVDSEQPLRTLVTIVDRIRTRCDDTDDSAIEQDAIKLASRRGRLTGLAGVAGASAEGVTSLLHEAWTTCELSVALDPSVSSERIAGRCLAQWGLTENPAGGELLLTHSPDELGNAFQARLVPDSSKPKDLVAWMGRLKDFRERIAGGGDDRGFLAKRVPGLGSGKAARSAREDMEEVIAAVRADHDAVRAGRLSTSST